MASIATSRSRRGDSAPATRADDASVRSDSAPVSLPLDPVPQAEDLGFKGKVRERSSDDSDRQENALMTMLEQMMARLEALEARGAPVTSLGGATASPSFSAPQRQGSGPSLTSGVSGTPNSESSLGDASASETGARGGSDVREAGGGGVARVGADADAHLTSPAAAVAAHLGWVQHDAAAMLLERALEPDVLLPAFDERAVMERIDELDDVSGDVRDLEDAYGVDTTRVAQATLFIEPVMTSAREKDFVRAAGNEGIAWAMAYREWARAVGKEKSATERELFKALAKGGGAVPKRWLAWMKKDDSSTDLNVCSVHEKPPKAFVESQRALRDIVRGVGDTLDDMARVDGLRALELAVFALRRIQLLAAGAVVSNAESSLAAVIDVSAESYKPDARAKVDRALTEAERKDADRKAALKAQLESTAAHQKIAQLLVAAPKSGQQYKAAAGAGAGAGGAGDTAAGGAAGGKFKHGNKKRAGAAQQSNGAKASAAASNAADESAGSPSAVKEGGHKQ